MPTSGEYFRILSIMHRISKSIMIHRLKCRIPFTQLINVTNEENSFQLKKRKGKIKEAV